MRARKKIPRTLVAAALFVGAGASPALAQTPGRAPLDLPPIDALSETVERPLFRPDRRPPSEEEAQEDIENAESGLFSLVGIIVSPTQRIALVKVRGSQTVLQLSEGQQANGWTVLQIRPEEVIFESNDKTETIELIDIKPPSRARRPAARERQPQQPAPNKEQ
jgi:hypothetical protein